MKQFWKRLICFFKGHDVYRRRWKYVYQYRLKHKGGQKKNRGKYTHTTKHYEDICLRCGKTLKRMTSAPRLDQAQAWFRNKGVYINVDLAVPRKEEKLYYYIDDIKGFLPIELFGSEGSEENFDSYEEALSAGITKCLELLEKGI